MITSDQDRALDGLITLCDSLEVHPKEDGTLVVFMVRRGHRDRSGNTQTSHQRLQDVQRVTVQEDGTVAR